MPPACLLHAISRKINEQKIEKRIDKFKGGKYLHTYVAEHTASGHMEQNSGVQSGSQFGILFSTMEEKGPRMLLFTLGTPRKRKYSIKIASRCNKLLINRLKTTNFRLLKIEPITLIRK